ncbi:MAG: hypothetical protein K6F37_08585 [Lachnospiraceae bacterium]|nr:hypothetical protein [Lachnospiraceae bacterium]
MTFYENHKKDLAILAVLLICALISFAFIAPYASSVETHSKSIECLDNKRDDVLKLTAASTATSVVISLVPGDAGTPIANKLADLSGYFLIILCAIYLEKYLITITGYACFRILIPIALILFGINRFAKNSTFQRIAVKLTLFGFAIFLIIPTSVKISNIIEETYESSIDSAISSAEETENALSSLTGTTGGSTDISGSSNEDASGSTDNSGLDSSDADSSDSSTESNGWLGILSGVLGNAVDNVSDAVAETTEKAESAINNISDTIDSVKSGELIEKAGVALNNFIEAAAVMLITSCVIPVLVMIFMFWVVKILLEFDLGGKLYGKSE